MDTLDHDFPSAGEGKVFPHGLYDLARNEGYVHLNTCHDTSEFCCDSVAHWWQQHGCTHYPNVRRLLLLCDGGGGGIWFKQCGIISATLFWGALSAYPWSFLVSFGSLGLQVEHKKFKNQYVKAFLCR